MVVAPSSMGVGLLEFHQLDRVVQSGRAAARALLEQASGDLRPVAATGIRAVEPVPEVLLAAQSPNGHPSTIPGGRPGSM